MAVLGDGDGAAPGQLPGEAHLPGAGGVGIGSIFALAGKGEGVVDLQPAAVLFIVDGMGIHRSQAVAVAEQKFLLVLPSSLGKLRNDADLPRGLGGRGL